MIVEYPRNLPPPLSGSSISPTERRRISNIQGPSNYRTVQRDYGGTKRASFIFTPAQAEAFRMWWEGRVAYGGGWFAANWPLLNSRVDNVFRFVAPPEWSLAGGGIDGLGHWRVNCEFEIRGRGELPELELLSVTSRPYPIYYADSLKVYATAKLLNDLLYYDNVSVSGTITAFTGTQTIYSSYAIAPEALEVSGDITAFTGAQTIYGSYVIPAEALEVSGTIAALSAFKQLIVYDKYPPEALEVSGTITALTSP